MASVGAAKYADAAALDLLSTRWDRLDSNDGQRCRTHSYRAFG